MDKQQQFSLNVSGDYVHLKTWGPLIMDDLEAPARAALMLAQERRIDKLLDDIRDVDTSDVSMRLQAKAMGILWKLRTFKKVAIILQGSRIKNLFFSTLDVLHLSGGSTFKGFESEAEAIAWLQED